MCDPPEQLSGLAPPSRGISAARAAELSADDASCDSSIPRRMQNLGGWETLHPNDFESRSIQRCPWVIASVRPRNNDLAILLQVIVEQ